MSKPGSERADPPAEAVAADRLEQLAEERRVTQGSRFWRRLRRERKAFVGIIFVAFLIFVALAGPYIAPYDPDEDDFGLFESPSLSHPMGTDSFGRDLFSRMIIGTRVSFT
ncbi:MAG: ABC transporter permease, partial [Vicinamibacterales bacterium]